MTRTLLHLAGGVILGLMIHLVMILILPSQATRDLFSKLGTLDTLARVTILPPVAAGEPNPFGLDPEMIYAVCQLDLRDGPGVVGGILPDEFWSVSLFDRNGVVVYATTNREGIGQRLQMGIFNPAQTRMLREQAIDVADGLLIVETPSSDVLVLVRLAPAHHASRVRNEAAMANITCGNAA